MKRPAAAKNAMRPAAWMAMLLFALLATSALAHEGPHHLAEETSGQQIWNTITGVSLAVIAGSYMLGLRRLWKTEGGRQSVPKWQPLAFAAGCASAAIALLSPMDRWSDTLFSAHMAQHEVLMLISAPLMVLGRPFIVTMWSLDAGKREAIGGFLRRPWLTTVWGAVTGPFTVLILHAAVLWVWHVPYLFELALHNETVHVVQHLGFFLTAALFWWALVHGRYGRLGYGVALLYVFATAMHTEILGALLTFGSRTWYPTHAQRSIAAGFDPVADQQLAGIVMWIPFGVVFVLIGLALFAAWVGEAERRVAFTTSERAFREGRA